MPSTLCSPCQSIFSGPRQAGQLYQHHESLQAVADSAKAGCHLCYLLQVSSLHDSFPFRPNIYLPHQPQSDCLHDAASNPIAASDRKVRYRIDSEEIEFIYQDGASVVVHMTPVHNTNITNQDDKSRIVARSTGSKSSIELAARWIRHCQENHPGCSFANPSNWIPSRLIDVLVSPPRLVHRSDADANEAYATLSHRWKGSMTKLLHANMKAYGEGVPLEDLPKTFQEAIDVTRRLSIRYLWIDSLCIIQDSKEDWRTESALMGQVYQYGVVNLAATAAASGEESLFVDREPLWFTPCVVTSTWEYTDDEVDEAARLQNSTWSLFTTDQNNEQCLFRYPIQRRGWILQERFLSPRTIHFAYQLHWECRGRASEMFPRGAPMLIWPDTALTKLCRAQQPLEPRGAEIWKDVVEQYSECELTFQTDKLVAVAGIAQQFFKEEDYLAGLSKRSILPQLLWHAWGNSIERDEMSSQQNDVVHWAPSWSWASATSMVRFWSIRRSSTGTEHELSTVLEANATPLHKELPFGQVKDAHLTLHTRWIVAVDGSQQKSRARNFFFDSSWPATTYFLVPLLTANENDGRGHFEMQIYGLIIKPSESLKRPDNHSISELASEHLQHKETPQAFIRVGVFGVSSASQYLQDIAWPEWNQLPIIDVTSDLLAMRGVRKHSNEGWVVDIR